MDRNRPKMTHIGQKQTETDKNGQTQTEVDTSHRNGQKQTETDGLGQKWIEKGRNKQKRTKAYRNQ